jgi:hypothetical protein
MIMKGSNANINGTAATALVAATLSAITIASAFVATLGFAGRVNGALRNGHGSLRLNLRHRFGYSLRLNDPRGNRQGRKRGNLHTNLTKLFLMNTGRIIAGYYKKSINYFMPMISIATLGLADQGSAGLAQCTRTRLS